MTEQILIDAEELQERLEEVVLLDCRFELADPGAGVRAYAAGHIPGAHYIHLERDLSGPVQTRGEFRPGGRHPLPAPAQFAARMASLGIERRTPVVAYDDHGFAFAARLWWMLKSLDYRDVRVLDGGLRAWRASGGSMDTGVPSAKPVDPPVVGDYAGKLDYQGVLAARSAGAQLVDSRDAHRYQGVEEPIDPVAGHIPGAVNLPFQGVTDETGRALPADQLAARYVGLDEDRELVVYCGSGVTACVNLLGLSLAGRRGKLYPGSWSDWCARMEEG